MENVHDKVKYPIWTRTVIEKIRNYPESIYYLVVIFVVIVIGWRAPAELSSFGIMVLVVFLVLAIARFSPRSLLVLFLFLFPFNYWTFIYPTPIGQINLNLNELLILLLFLVWVSNLLCRGRLTYKINLLNKLVLLYVALSFVLLINSPLNSKAVYKAIMRSVEFGALFFVMANNIDGEEKHLKKISSLLILAMFLVCIFSLWEISLIRREFPQSFIAFHQKMIQIGLYPPRELYKIELLSREGSTVGSTFGSKAALSIYLSAILPLAITLGWFSSQVWKKALFWGIAIIGFFCLLLTGSRAGVLAFLGGMLVILFLLKTKKLFSSLLILAMVIFLTSFFLPQGLQKRLMFKTHESSLPGRMECAKRSLMIIRNNALIGAGVDSLGAGPAQSKPHNAFLTEFQTKGIVGFLIISGIFFTAFRQSLLSWKKAKKGVGFKKAISLWSIAAITVYFVHSLGAEPFGENQTVVLFILAVVLGTAAKTKEKIFKES